MTYHSTRGRAPTLPFDEALLAGLAEDGGLYLPTSWPRFSKADIAALAGLSYAEIATRVMLPFLDGTIAEGEFAQMCEETYGVFDHEAVAPLVQLGPNDWLLELFHGPTLSFKDYALQLVGRLFDRVLKAKKRRVTIIGATSGDTGSAAIEACRDRDAIEIVILHPHGRVSEVQRRQMTTVLSPNVHNLAIDGTFDDCQDLVKAMFNDASLRAEANLAAVNSINWARIMAQIVYYFVAGVALGAPSRKISFAVPTGNFGNVFAAHAARQMGLPIAQLVIGSNANDILPRFVESGVMQIEGSVATLSPSMDIQISSNFERYLYEMLNGDSVSLTAHMNSLKQSGRFKIGNAAMNKMRAVFDAYALDDAGTLAAIKILHGETGQLIDPHSAIGIMAGRARRRDDSVPMVAVATAHPAKFADAVEKMTGVRPELPPRLSDLETRPERVEKLPNDLAAVKNYVRRIARVNS